MKSGTLSLLSNADNAPLVVTLSGTGVQANGALAAVSSSNFGTVTVGSNASRQFTFSNTGTAPATGVYASVGAVPGLTLSANTCGTQASPSTVAAGDSCSVTVDWTPAAAGALSASLVVSSSAGNSPSSLTLSGTAAYMSSLYAPFDGSIEDLDTGTTGTMTNVFGSGTTGTGVLSSAQSVTGGTSMLFTSSGSGTTLWGNAGGVVFPQNAGLAFGTGDYTISMKFYRTAGTNDYSSALASFKNAGARTLLFVEDEGTSVSFVGFFSGSSYYARDVQIVPNRWYDVKVTRRSGQLRIYIDGALQNLYTSGTPTLLGTAASNTSNLTGTPQLVVGNQAGAAGDAPRMWRGHIDEVRVYSRDIVTP